MYGDKFYCFDTNTLKCPSLYGGKLILNFILTWIFKQKIALYIVLYKKY